MQTEKQELSLNTSFENFNLHIEKAAGIASFVASVRDEEGNILAENNFQYRGDSFIFSRLEDSVGRDIPDNAGMIMEAGSGIFNSVFSGKVLEYYKSLTTGSKQLRMKLFFKQEEPDLLRIPWEFMFDGTSFLSASPRMTMTRVLKGLPVDKRAKIEGRIRMLVVISSPLDLSEHNRLQIEKEQMIILQAVDRIYSSSSIDLEFLDEASLKNSSGQA